MGKRQVRHGRSASKTEAREKQKKKDAVVLTHISPFFFSFCLIERERENYLRTQRHLEKSNAPSSLLFSSVYVYVCVCIFKSTAMKLPSCVLRVTLHRKGKQKKKKSATLYMETTKIHQFIEKKKRGRMKRQVMH